MPSRVVHAAQTSAIVAPAPALPLPSDRSCAPHHEASTNKEAAKKRRMVGPARVVGAKRARWGQGKRDRNKHLPPADGAGHLAQGTVLRTFPAMRHLHRPAAAVAFAAGSLLLGGCTTTLVVAHLVDKLTEGDPTSCFRLGSVERALAAALAPTAPAA